MFLKAVALGFFGVAFISAKHRIPCQYYLSKYKSFKTNQILLPTYTVTVLSPYVSS